MTKKKILKIAEQCGATHKTNLGVYQFYESELLQFTDLLLSQVIARLHSSKYTEGDLHVSHAPLALVQFNSAIDSAIDDVVYFKTNVSTNEE
ncbi:hypothetical protein UFOVP116_180 [uncultured Caudovirales phage]|uniref:Uncharacterized protein n=1 Tax=uncultured Caudovirales phage TaxID=2100421 RepID=A0A6J5L6B0_9CAUD|nr:hypothetical protein UFOVP116_180 [uncultured Caudovirales phage]